MSYQQRQRPYPVPPIIVTHNENYQMQYYESTTRTVTKETRSVFRTAFETIPNNVAANYHQQSSSRSQMPEPIRSRSIAGGCGKSNCGRVTRRSCPSPLDADDVFVDGREHFLTYAPTPASTTCKSVCWKPTSSAGYKTNASTMMSPISHSTAMTLRSGQSVARCGTVRNASGASSLMAGTGYRPSCRAPCRSTSGMSPVSRSRASMFHSANPMAQSTTMLSEVKTSNFRGTTSTTRRPPPAQKMTLIKKIQQRSTHAGQNAVQEYLEDHYHYMLSIEWRCVLKQNALNSQIGVAPRMHIVDSLVKFQGQRNLSETTLFVSIRIFDFVIASINVNANQHILIAAVSLWVANKYHDNKVITSSQLIQWCNNRISKHQLIQMEMFILKVLKFQVNVADPSIFLGHYFTVFYQIIENSDYLRYACYYVLECYALDMNFSRTPPSMLAAATFHIVLYMLKVDVEPFLRYVSREQDEKAIVRLSGHLLDVVKRITTDLQSPYRNTFQKYDTPERMDVSQLFESF